VRVLVALALLLVACGPREGTVVNFGVVPAHWDYDTGSTCFAYDKDMNCTYRAENPPRYVPDTCYVRIKDVEHDGAEGDIQVPCDTLDEYRVGQYVRFG
jgi:hypothetical protein